jgi:hypothetical protein
LSVADLLKDGPLPITELANATRMHAPSLKRMMRFLTSVGVFDETDNGDYALTSLGDALREDAPASMRASVMIFGGIAVQDNWRDLEYCVKTGRPAFAKRAGSTPFVATEKYPEQAAKLDAALANLTKRAAEGVCAAYDFGPFRHIVDVGGGSGVLITEILRRNTHLRGVLYDQPRVAERASRFIAHAGLTERCEVIGGDFFSAVPKGGDAYILKDVIHDWDERLATKILRCCNRAMRASSKLLILEDVDPPRIDQSIDSRDAAANDMNMLVSFGGRQRSEDEFRSLYASADFTLTRIVRTDTRLAIVEGVCN